VNGSGRFAGTGRTYLMLSGPSSDILVALAEDMRRSSTAAAFTSAQEALCISVSGQASAARKSCKAFQLFTR
jgi:hypothetical protein